MRKIVEIKRKNEVILIAKFYFNAFFKNAGDFVKRG
jgi:hypothetical protein